MNPLVSTPIPPPSAPAHPPGGIPEVTVMLAHYRCERYLRDAVCSILRQDVDLALWIIDDCSADDAWLDGIRDLAVDPRVSVYQTTRNVGHYRIKNVLLPLVRSPLIAFQDADDISDPPRLRRQLDTMRRSGAAIVGTGFRYIGEHGEQRETRRMVRRCNLWLRAGRSFVLLHPTSLIRRDVFDTIGGFDGTARFAADDDFLLRASMLFRIRNVPEPLYSYRMRPDSLTGSPQTGHASEVRRVYRTAMLARAAARRRVRSRAQLLQTLQPPANDVPFEVSRVWTREAAPCS